MSNEVEVPLVPESVAAENLLRLALDVGEGMLKNGGEINRVEDTIHRICCAYGAVHTEIFVVPSVMIAAIRLENGDYSSQVRRVYNTENHMARLEKLNAISRAVCRDLPPLSAVDAMIRDAKREKTYPRWLQIPACVLGAGASAMLFGGSLRDGIAAGLVGAVFALINFIRLPKINQFAITAMQSLLGGLLAYLLVMAGLGEDVGKIMIGTVMLLIPGLAFGTALRDLFSGDFLAGSLKTVHIVLMALMIAFGYMLAIFTMGNVTLPPVEPVPLNYAVRLVAACLTSIGFALFFRVRLGFLPWAALGGGGTYAVYALVEHFGFVGFLPALLASAFCALYAESFARIKRSPAVVFLFPCSVPITPGGYLYYTMSNFISRNNDAAWQYLGQTLAVGLGVAGGIVAVSILVNLYNGTVNHIRQRKTGKSK